jgi:hypothetical protein
VHPPDAPPSHPICVPSGETREEETKGKKEKLKQQFFLGSSLSLSLPIIFMVKISNATFTSQLPLSDGVH